MTSFDSIALLTPEIVLVAAALVAYLGGAFAGLRHGWLVALVGIVAAMSLAGGQPADERPARRARILDGMRRGDAPRCLADPPRHLEGPDHHVVQVAVAGGGRVPLRLLQRHEPIGPLRGRGGDQPLEVAVGDVEVWGDADEAQGEQAGHARGHQRPHEMAADGRLAVGETLGIVAFFGHAARASTKHRPAAA